MLWCFAAPVEQELLGQILLFSLDETLVVVGTQCMSETRAKKEIALQCFGCQQTCLGSLCFAGQNTIWDLARALLSFVPELFGVLPFAPHPLDCYEFIRGAFSSRDASPGQLLLLLTITNNSNRPLH